MLSLFVSFHRPCLSVPLCLSPLCLFSLSLSVPLCPSLSLPSPLSAIMYTTVAWFHLALGQLNVCVCVCVYMFVCLGVCGCLLSERPADVLHLHTVTDVWLALVRVWGTGRVHMKPLCSEKRKGQSAN